MPTLAEIRVMKKEEMLRVPKWRIRLALMQLKISTWRFKCGTWLLRTHTGYIRFRSEVRRWLRGL